MSLLHACTWRRPPICSKVAFKEARLRANSLDSVACTTRMNEMAERRNARRYDLLLPVMVRVPAEVKGLQEGETRDISTRGLYFVTEQDVQAGSELDITLTLPAELTHGSDVFVRAAGKVVRVDPRTEARNMRFGVAAVIERYDIIRDDSAHHN